MLTRTAPRPGIEDIADAQNIKAIMQTTHIDSSRLYREAFSLARIAVRADWLQEWADMRVGRTHSHADVLRHRVTRSSTHASLVLQVYK